MKKRRLVLSVFVLIAAVLVLAACDGANSSSWRNTVNQSERSFDGGFTITVGSARSGQRNRTFSLSADELGSIHVNSTSAEGEIILVISQNGAEDGTEVRMDISNFTGYVPADDLTPGRIRFSLHFEGIRSSETTIRWQ